MTDIEVTLDALTGLVHQGKVRYIGCSNLSAWHVMKCVATSERRGLEPYSGVQSYYSLLCRDLEHELLPMCLDQNIGILVWSPLAGGFLSGKFGRDRKWPANTRIARAGFPELDVEYAFTVVDEVVAIAENRGVSAAEVSLNWLLEREGVASVIVGARTREQLETNLNSVTWTLSTDELNRLDAVSARPKPYPYWHQFHFNAERQPLLHHERSPGYALRDPE